MGASASITCPPWKTLPVQASVHSCSGRKVNLAPAHPELGDGGHEQIGAEEELVFHRRGLGIVGKVEEQWPHRRQASFRGQLHLLHDIAPQTLPQQHGRPDMRIGVPADGPGLVVGPAAMRAEDWQEDPILIPAHHQFLKAWTRIVMGDKPADVATPPRNAAHHHVQPHLHVFFQMLEGTKMSCGSGAGPVTLAARPGIAADGHHLLLAGCQQPFVDVLLMGHREQRMGFPGRADVKQDLIVVLDLVKLIARIEPEGADAEIDSNSSSTCSRGIRPLPDWSGRIGIWARQNRRYPSFRQWNR